MKSPFFVVSAGLAGSLIYTVLLSGLAAFDICTTPAYRTGQSYFLVVLNRFQYSELFINGVENYQDSFSPKHLNNESLVDLINPFHTGYPFSSI